MIVVETEVQIIYAAVDKGMTTAIVQVTDIDDAKRYHFS